MTRYESLYNCYKCGLPFIFDTETSSVTCGCGSYIRETQYLPNKTFWRER